MAPVMTGILGDDHSSSVELCLQASDFAEKILTMNGWFICKVFIGQHVQKFRNYLESRFSKVRKKGEDEHGQGKSALI